jgi:hypothetical protein
LDRHMAQEQHRPAGLAVEAVSIGEYIVERE